MEMSFTEKIFSLTAVKYQWRHFRFLFQGTTNLEILKIHHVPFIIIVCNGCKHLALILNIVEQLFVIPKSPFWRQYIDFKGQFCLLCRHLRNFELPGWRSFYQTDSKFWNRKSGKIGQVFHLVLGPDFSFRPSY